MLWIQTIGLSSEICCWIVMTCQITLVELSWKKRYWKYKAKKWKVGRPHDMRSNKRVTTRSSEATKASDKSTGEREDIESESEFLQIKRGERQTITAKKRQQKRQRWQHQPLLTTFIIQTPAVRVNDTPQCYKGQRQQYLRSENKVNLP